MIFKKKSPATAHLEESTTAEPCLNCGWPVAKEEFCAKCGQQNTEKIVPLKEFILDIASEFVTFDTKITRSLVPLIIRPGFLTNEYIAGKRGEYLIPSRIYVIISVIFFFFVQTFSPIEMDVEILKDYGVDFTNPAILDKAASAIADVFPPSFFVVIPFFAAFLKILYARQKRMFVEHLIFSFHFYSVFLLGIMPALFYDDVEIISEIGAFFALFIFPSLYLYFSIRRVYKQSIAVSLLKTFFAYSAFAILLGTARHLTMSWVAAHLK